MLRAHDLDFSCHGRSALSEACAERGLDAESVLREIDSAEPEPVDLTVIARQPVPTILAFIEQRYHEELRRELPLLVALARGLEQSEATDTGWPLGLLELLDTLREALADHLDQEDHVLFPLIRAGLGRLAGPSIQVMEREHQDHRRSLARMREITAGLTLPPGASPPWCELYERLDRVAGELIDHIHLENNVVFPRALCE